MQDDRLTLESRLSSGLADEFFSSLSAGELLFYAAEALALGLPDVAARWSPDPLVKAAAFLRMGQPQEAKEALRDVENARVAVLRARAAWQLQHPEALPLAETARRLARQEGDAEAIIASAALLGELHLTEPRVALRTLAEGLKVAEVIGAEADAYLLAVLAHAQARAGGTDKAQKTARKALARSPDRSPARAVALLALNRPADAREVAAAGKLGGLWLIPFTPALRQ